MTPDHYLKLLIGDLAVQNAILRAELDQLRAELEKYKTPAVPDTKLHAV